MRPRCRSPWRGCLHLGWTRLAGAIRKVLIGRRFVASLERNRDAADHLDRALKELLERP